MQNRIPTREEAIAELARRKASLSSLNYGAKAPQSVYNSEKTGNVIAAPVFSENQQEISVNRIPTKEEARAELARRKQAKDENNPSINFSKGFDPLGGLKFNEAMLPSFLSSFTGSRPTQKIASNIGEQIAGQETIAPEFGRMLGTAAQYAPFGEAAGPSLLKQIIAGGAFGGATAQPNQENAFGYLPKGRPGAIAEGALLNTLPGLSGKILESLRPSKMFRGGLSPEELHRNLSITKGTETGLGDVIGSPFLKKKLENTLTMTPFSGANESLQRTGKEVVRRGEDILDEMLRVRSPHDSTKILHEYDPHQIPQIISEDLNKQFIKHQKIKNNIYENANRIAYVSGLKLELPKFSQQAKEYSDAIEATNMLKFEPDSARIFNKLKNYVKPVKETKVTGLLENKEGHPLLDETLTKHPTLKEANILKGNLRRYAEMVGQSPDPAMRNMANIFNKLSKNLKEDILSGIEKTGNKELKRVYLGAEKNYEENFSPFLDKDIYRYLGRNSNPEEIINSFVKTKPTADLANQITKISEAISPQSKSLLGYSYLSRSLDNEGNLNPAKLGTAIEKLKPNQFKALFSDPEIRRRLKDYSSLQHMNKEAQNLMFNPKTGQRTTDVLVTGLLGALGEIGTGNVGALLAPAAAIGLGRLSTKALTNEKIRASLVEEMIKNRTRFTTPAKGTQSLLQSLSQELQQGNQ